MARPKSRKMRAHRTINLTSQWPRYVGAELVVTDDLVEYQWTFTGTIAETGKSVRIPGLEEWTIDADGHIAESWGHYDQAEYDRQALP